MTGMWMGQYSNHDIYPTGIAETDLLSSVSYFTTSIPGSGIFLPVHRAEKRFSPALSTDSFPATPHTPSSSTFNGYRSKAGDAYTPPTPALPPKLSQTVGPGARPPSPQFKPKRPSLPRPESPFRKQPPNLAPTPAKGLSQSQRGTRPPGLPTTTPSKSNLKASTSRAPAQTPRPYSRTGSRAGGRAGAADEDDKTPVGMATTSARTTSIGSVPSFSQPLRSPSRLGSAGGQDAEIQRLKKELADRDRRLEEQAMSLADMEASVKELSALIPTDDLTPGSRSSSLTHDDGQSATQLRQALREKNEKISLMTQEFDNHRADFRSTLDSLEMASSETERVYEEQKQDLLQQIATLQQENEELKMMASSKEDFDSITRQLKQLEELVAELEEGLEESRRGEAEARGEVEFLRGEVERGRSELRREREKAASLMENGGGAGEDLTQVLEQKDAEIAGLKAIIHNMSGSSPPAAGSNGSGYITDADEVNRLKAALEESRMEKEDLENQIEQLRRDSALLNRHTSTVHVRNESECTATAEEAPSSYRQRSGTVKATVAERARHNSYDELTPSADSDPEGIYCEMCHSREHDTLDCTTFQAAGALPRSEQSPYSPGNKENEASPTKVLDGGKKDEDKWCALCEKDGHLAFDCPEEQY